MLKRANIVYRYDGSFDGFLSCVFESFRAKTLPVSIETEETAQETLFPTKYIETAPDLALRVQRSFSAKISTDAEEVVKKVFLSCAPEKEILLLRFLNLGYQVGGKVTKLTTHPDVCIVEKIRQQVSREAYFSLEFLRFSQFGDFLAAQITPKNAVLPFMVYHFCDRFPDENFIIYDKTHKTAFLHRSSGETQFLHDTEITFPAPDEEEASYRRLWRHFYETITIETRKNAKLRRSNMPMRYWPNMTEFQKPEAVLKAPESPEMLPEAKG